MYGQHGTLGGSPPGSPAVPPRLQHTGQGVVLPLVDDLEVAGEDLGVRGPAALLGDDDLVVALEAGGGGQAAAGAVASEADLDPRAVAGAGDDVADGLRREAALQDGVSAGVQAAEGVAVRVVECGGVLPGPPARTGQMAGREP